MTRTDRPTAGTDVRSTGAGLTKFLDPLPRNGALPVDPNEQGRKDVIRVGGGQLVRVAGQFGGANGRDVYHCHILEHEDEGMMRTFVVMPKEVMALDPHITDHHHPLHPA